jgi:hypothetical protein
VSRKGKVVLLSCSRRFELKSLMSDFVVVSMIFFLECQVLLLFLNLVQRKYYTCLSSELCHSGLSLNSMTLFLFSPLFNLQFPCLPFDS